MLRLAAAIQAFRASSRVVRSSSRRRALYFGTMERRRSAIRHLRSWGRGGVFGGVDGMALDHVLQRDLTRDGREVQS